MASLDLLLAFLLSVLALGVLGAAASPRGLRAVDFYERLRSHGCWSSRHANVFTGAAAVSHGHDGQPPPVYAAFGDAASCSHECTWDVPTTLSRTGDEIIVKYKMNDSSIATRKDWVGLFEVDAPNEDYLDYFWASVDWTGYGQRTLHLYNLRTKLQFRYIKDHNCLCASPLIDFKGGLLEPTQAHIALTGDPTEMQLTWVSGHPFGFAEVRGREGLLASTTSSYVAANMCGPPATSTGPWSFRDVGFIHTVTLTGLERDTAYEYRCRHEEVTSEWTTFRTAPDGSEEWTAVAYGDMGIAGIPDTFYDQMPGARLVQLDLLTRKPRLALHFGDLSYARSVGFVWDVWGDQVSKIAGSVPYMVSLGNHEYDHTSGGAQDPSGVGNGFHPSWGNYGDDSGGECGVPVVKRFPNPPPTGNGIFWYSFDYANVHWVMLSSEHDYTNGSAQHRWLDKDLASVDRDKTPWLIVTAHRPAYNSEKYDGDRAVAGHMATELDPVLLRHQVNLFLAGHYHAYQRTCPVVGAECHEQPMSRVAMAPVHVTVGSAGASLDYVPVYKADKEWTIRTSETFGHLILRIRPESIIGEFWGAEDYDRPSLPFAMLDSFEVFPYRIKNLHRIIWI